MLIIILFTILMVNIFKLMCISFDKKDYIEAGTLFCVMIYSFAYFFIKTLGAV